MNEKISEASARTTMVAFGATVFIGGINFIAVKFSNAELPPLYGAAVRFGAAAMIFFAIAKVGRMELPRGAALVGASAYGLLNFGLGYALLYLALIGISAGTASVVLAAVPLITLVLAVLHGQERFTPRGVVGGLLVIGGIGVLSSQSIGGELPMGSLLFAVAGAFAVAESSVVVKGFPNSHPITTNAVGAAVGAVGLFAASAILRETWIVPELPRTWVVLAWLSVVGSVGLFGLFVFVIKRWTASATVYALTLMPVVAVTLGALLADESITPEVIGGGALVALGVYAGALSGQRGRAAHEQVRPSPSKEKALS